MGDLSRDFNRREFACKCGCGFDRISPDVVYICQLVRDLLGSPLRINSACRCQKHNKKAGGVPNSYHTQGLAADLSWNGNANKLFVILKALHNDGRIPKLEYCRLYPKKNFVHIDVGKKRNTRFVVTD